MQQDHPKNTDSNRKRSRKVGHLESWGKYIVYLILDILEACFFFYLLGIAMQMANTRYSAKKAGQSFLNSV